MQVVVISQGTRLAQVHRGLVALESKAAKIADRFGSADRFLGGSELVMASVIVTAAQKAPLNLRTGPVAAPPRVRVQHRQLCLGLAKSELGAAMACRILCGSES